MLGIRLGVGLALIGLLAGPGTPARPVEAAPVMHKVTLQPSEGGWAYHRHMLDAATLGDPTACDDEPTWDSFEDDSAPRVGYEHFVASIDELVDPVRKCVTNEIYQARLVFDVSALKQYPLAKDTRSALG